MFTSQTSYLSCNLDADFIQNLVDNILRLLFIPRLVEDVI